MEKVDWIREIHRFYQREQVVLSSYRSNAPHGRIEGQFGRQQSVKGYEHVIVYLQLSSNIDFDKVKYFLKLHLLEWIRNNRDYEEALDIFFFNNEKNELIHNKRSWTRFSAQNISLLDFIDNTIKQVNSNYIRTLYWLYPKTSMYTQYNQGKHPNNKDLLIFITDRKGCDFADNLKELLKRRIRKILWVKLEKEKDVIIEKRKIPNVDNELLESNSELYLDDVCDNKEINTLPKEDLANFDFYLTYATSDLLNQDSQKSIEISGNTLTIGDRLAMAFLRNIGEKYSIPIDKVIELKNKLLRLNIFQIEEDYPSVSLDGIYWGLSVRFNGKKISSKGHNNYPTEWSQIINAIEDCIKYKYKSSENIKEEKMVSKNITKNLMMKIINLNPNLFHFLEKNPPKWWENLKKDKEIVIEIRSDKRKSYINCYYNGGCILEKLDCDSKGNFKGQIHHKYIPIDFNPNNNYINYNFSNNNQNINYQNINPTIPDINNFENKTISSIKKQVENYYPNNSEKGHQYKFIQKDPYFIDSEFQYNKFIRNNLRIDLVRLDSSVKKIVFIELKEMSNKDLFNGKLEKQLELYKNFINNFKQEIFDYYLGLIDLKKKLGLLSKEVLKIADSKDLANYSIAEKPLLIITGCPQIWISNNAEDIKNRIKNFALGCLYFGKVNQNNDLKKKWKNRYIW